MTDLKRDYMAKANAEVDSELPYALTFTTGYINYVYCVSIPARHHQKASDYWKKYIKGKPILNSEYCD